MNNSILNANVKIEQLKKTDFESKFNVLHSGKILDFETIGNFGGVDNDYENIKITIVGIMDVSSNILVQFYNLSSDNKTVSSDLLKNILSLTGFCDYDFVYAFSSKFEHYIIKNHLGSSFRIEELQNPEHKVKRGWYERKQNIYNELNIENYDDPFNGNGARCVDEWINGNYKDCLMHNRACLLKERDLLYIRGCYGNSGV